MGKIEFYQCHLDRVSRSFAFCIARLETPLRAWVSLTYLVCRILDTVEDAPWKKTQHQIRQFDRFDQFLNQLPPSEVIEHWRQEFPEKIPSGEKELIQDSHQIFMDLHKAPNSVSQIIKQLVTDMSAGMRYYSQKRSHGQLRLKSQSEVNEYCFFVAGIVGEALAKLITVVEPKVKAMNHLMVDAHHFGQFLQKVNLLKDQMTDEQEGRFFVHSRNEVKVSLSGNAQGAWRFIESIPIEQKGFRLFCCWSLFIGLASIPWTDESFAKKKNLKIPRLQTKLLLSEIESKVDQPVSLEKLFFKLFDKAGLDRNVKVESELLKQFAHQKSEWFRQLYSGSLTSEDLMKLGIIA